LAKELQLLETDEPLCCCWCWGTDTRSWISVKIKSELNYIKYLLEWV
jgi:hypothetical protein